jgi:hypothetical protein
MNHSVGGLSEEANLLHSLLKGQTEYKYFPGAVAEFGQCWGGVINHWHYLELPAHSDNKKQANFQ